ncbi:hypothetical protein [Patulibacter minatonensis]|uniref:hypothetical protein n=1 Tax=Patulibacter minatonensis TaxID=298163 RepID=UPI00047BEC9A|nr:hypothetical protein [Patulibacter minatonensis]
MTGPGPSPEDVLVQARSVLDRVVLVAERWRAGMVGPEELDEIARAAGDLPAAFERAADGFEGADELEVVLAIRDVVGAALSAVDGLLRQVDTWRPPTGGGADVPASRDPARGRPPEP